jgi:hypothetical protein
VMHDACCTFKVPALHEQVQRKESIALIYQNADRPAFLGVGATSCACSDLRPRMSV